jgi:hypothetical protein
MRVNSYADHIRQWEELTTTVATNPDLASLEPLRVLLESELVGFRAANIRQASLRSQTQETSRAIEGFVGRGRDLATRLRDGIRSSYGRSAEQLVAFRMQPRRSRPKAQTPPPEDDKPSELGSTPARTAAPETDASTQGVTAV